MEVCSAVIKVLLILTFSVHLSSAVTPTLEYRYTLITPGETFTAVGLLDGKQVMQYNISERMLIPNECIKEREPESYWENESDNVRDQQDWLTTKLRDLKGSNQAGSLQRVYGCKIDDTNITRGYDKSIYNGTDFITLDLNTGTWTAVDERAKSFTENWNPARKSAASWKDFLMGPCKNQLEKYMPCRDTPPTPPTPPPPPYWVIGLIGVLVLVATAAGYLIYKRKPFANLISGYAGARQNPEQ